MKEITDARLDQLEPLHAELLSVARTSFTIHLQEKFGIVLGGFRDRDSYSGLDTVVREIIFRLEEKGLLR